jgi:hypothetical protein
MMKPDAAATTHPALLCALVKMLKSRGAEVIIGDSPGGLYTSPVVNRIYESFFEAPYPARSCVQVAGIPKGALVEIECIAVKE